MADLPEEHREAAKASVKRTLGGDETAVWLGTDGKTVLQLAAAKDWADARALAEAYLDKSAPLAKDPAYQSTRKQLPAEATLLVAAGHGADGSLALRHLPGAAGAVPGFPRAAGAKAPAGKPAYIGMALVLRPGHGSFELFVPAAAVDPVRKLVEPLLDDK